MGSCCMADRLRRCHHRRVSALENGRSLYKKGTEQGRPYLSGNAEPEKGAVHIRASNLYWGYLQALKGYYDTIVPMHTGILTDYMVWFVAVTALLLVIIGGLP